MSISILQWNVRSFLPNKHFIRMILDEQSPTIMCFQETRCKKSQQLSITGYTCVSRSDREENRSGGGGVAILCSNLLPSDEIQIRNTNLEICAIQVYKGNLNLTIVNLYLPPSRENNDIKSELDNIINQISGQYIISMDSNAHHPAWGSDRPDRRGEIIEDWINENDLIILNDGSPTYETHNGNYTHIDLTICSPSIAAQLNWYVHEDTVHSDHFPIIINTNEGLEEVVREPKYKFEQANWKKYVEKLEIPIPKNEQAANELYEELVNKIIAAADEAIPKTSPNIKFKHCKFFWTQECTQAKKMKNKARQAYKRNRGNLELWIEFKKQKARFRYILNKAKKESWKEFVSN